MHILTAVKTVALQNKGLFQTRRISFAPRRGRDLFSRGVASSLFFFLFFFCSSPLGKEQKIENRTQWHCILTKIIIDMAEKEESVR